MHCGEFLRVLCLGLNALFIIILLGMRYGWSQSLLSFVSSHIIKIQDLLRKEKNESKRKEVDQQKTKKQKTYLLFYTAQRCFCNTAPLNTVEKCSFYLFCLFFYAMVIVIFREVYIGANPELKKSPILIAYFFFWGWIFDIVAGILINMIKALLIIAMRKPKHKKNEYLAYIETFIFITVVYFDYYVFKPQGDELLVVSLYLMVLTVFVIKDLYQHTQELLKRLIKGGKFLSKTEAIDECILMYVSYIIILTIVLFLSALLMKDFFSTADITFDKCFRYCTMTFIGMGTDELKPNNEMAYIATFVIRIIGLVTTGFIATEILSHVLSAGKQEEYWNTRYELQHILNLINEIDREVVTKQSTRYIDKTSLEKIIESLPKKSDGKYYADCKRHINYRLLRLNYLLTGLIDDIEKKKSLKIDDIERRINADKIDILQVEKKLQDELNKTII